MKAALGIPLAMGIALALSGTFLYLMEGNQASASQSAQWTQPMNPDEFRYPVCTSRDNDWGVYKAYDGSWYVNRPGAYGPQRFTGSWRQFPKLTNLYCEEAR